MTDATYLSSSNSSKFVALCTWNSTTKYGYSAVSADDAARDSECAYFDEAFGVKGEVVSYALTGETVMDGDLLLYVYVAV